MYDDDDGGMNRDGSIMNENTDYSKMYCITDLCVSIH